MNLIGALRKTTIKELENMNVDYIGILAREYEEVFSTLISKKIISEKDIKSSLEQAVIKKAKENYYITLKNEFITHGVDHLVRPECLAYAVLKGDVFSKEEINKIPLEYPDKDMGDFLRTYKERDILEDLKEELLNPKPLPKIDNSYFDIHPACC